MQYTKAFTYAVAAISQIAAHGSAEPIRCGTICDRIGLPEGFALQILTKLVHAGIVISRRGPIGGYALSRPAGEITLLSIFEATQPIEGYDLPLDGFTAAAREVINSAVNGLAEDIRRRLVTLTVADLKTH